MDLYRELNEIIRRYHVNAIYERKADFVDFHEMNDYIWNSFCEQYIKEDSSISLYGGGMVGRTVYKHLGKKINIKYVIDNYVKWEDENVVVLSYEEWLNGRETDYVLITNLRHAECFKTQLYLDAYSGTTVDVDEWMQKYYPDIEWEQFWKREDEILCSGEFKVVNKFIRQYQEEKNYCILRKIIYILFLLKDFFSAEYYIEEVFRYSAEDYRCYKQAIAEVRDILEKVAVQVRTSDTIINLLDGFSNQEVEIMPFFSEYAKNNCRLSSVITCYPATSWAFCEIFTKKKPFEMELENIEISRDNSEILKYAYEKEIDFYFVSGHENSKKRMNVNKNDFIICDKEEIRLQRRLCLSQVLFEGLQLLCNNENPKIIFLYSWMELHDPYAHVGGYVNEEEVRRLSSEDFISNRISSYLYVDKELEYYYYYYNKIACSVITMGDHGMNKAFSPIYFMAESKRDIALCSYEKCNPAVIIHADDIKGINIGGLIPMNRIQDILMMVIKKEISNRFSEIESMQEEFVELQQVPIYNAIHCEKYIQLKKWGYYEAAIGVCRRNEVYLKYITGKEIYYRLNEHQYRNLIDDMKYKECIEECRKLLEGKEVPPELYMKEKYEEHMRILQKYNPDEYECIFKKMM